MLFRDLKILTSFFSGGEKRGHKEVAEEETAREKPTEIIRKWFEVFHGGGHVHTEISGRGEKANAPGEIVRTPPEARYSLGEIFSYLEDIIKSKGPRYIDHFVITDHASSAGAPEALTSEEEKLFLDQKRKLDELNKKYQVKGVAGIEASFISSKGKLDISDELADKMDLVIASMHGVPKRDHEGKPLFDEKGQPIYKKLSSEEKTKLCEEAILGAAENPHVDIIGHPTRHLSLEVLKTINWDKIFKKLAETGTAVEMNLNNPMAPIWVIERPIRKKFESDEEYEKALKEYETKMEYSNQLREILKKAKKCGVKFFIGIDFHTLEQFWQQPFRNFTAYELGLLSREIEGAQKKPLSSKEKEYYDEKIKPKLVELSSEDKKLISKIAEGKLKPEEIKKIDQERLSRTPGVRFWLRLARLFLEMDKAGIDPEKDVINITHEKLLQFCQSPKKERIKFNY